jgi:hypothetical protein
VFADALTLLHVVSTLGMGLVIWDVQLRRYPAFAAVPASRFGAFHRRHTERISYLVIPLMLSELATAALLLVVPDATTLTSAERWLGVGLVVAVWTSTFAVQVPLHTRLSRSFDREAIRRLVATNWLRTALWSGRSLLVLLSFLR